MERWSREDRGNAAERLSHRPESCVGVRARPALPGQARTSLAGEKACVRLDHLRLTGGRTPFGPAGARRRRGSGSMREVRPGVWRLTVSDGPGPDGPIRRRHPHFPRCRGRRGGAPDEPGQDDARHEYPTVAWPRRGREYAALLDHSARCAPPRGRRRVGRSNRRHRAVHRLLGDVYRWARRRQWTRRDPLADVDLRDIIR